MTAPEQRAAALRAANRVRTGRVALRRDLRAGRTSIADALTHPAADTLPVGTLLCWQHGVGDRRASVMLRHAGIVDSARPCGRLTGRQRTLLDWACTGRWGA